MGKKCDKTVELSRPRWTTGMSVEEMRQRDVVPLTASGDIDWVAVVGSANAERLGVIATIYDMDMRNALKVIITESYNLAMNGLMVGGE